MATMETTTLPSNTTTPESSEEHYYYRVSKDVFVIISPIILAAGLLGNALTVAVMTRPTLRHSSMAVYLSVLAVSDTLVLTLDFLNNWFEFALDINLLDDYETYCRFHRYFFNVIYTYSSWLVLAVSVDRFIMVWRPGATRVLCTVKAALIVCPGLLVLSFLVYVYRAWSWHINEDGKCGFTGDFQYFMKYIGPWKTAALYSYIPIIVLIILNVLIVIRMRKMTRAGTSARLREDSASSKMAAIERKVTYMSVAICVAFCLLTLPAAIYYILAFAQEEFIFSSPKYALAETIILLFVLCNYAINFYLYVLSGEAFRAELKRMFCCRGKYDDKEMSHTLATYDSHVPVY